MPKKIQTAKKSTWTVQKFDSDTLVGVVRQGNSNQSFTFHSTSFQSNTGFRFPEQGEKVEVVLTSSGGLLGVRGK